MKKNKACKEVEEIGGGSGEYRRFCESNQRANSEYKVKRDMEIKQPIFALISALFNLC